jgi:hypothetical protein
LIMSIPTPRATPMRNSAPTTAPAIRSPGYVGAAELDRSRHRHVVKRTLTLKRGSYVLEVNDRISNQRRRV